MSHTTRAVSSMSGVAAVVTAAVVVLVSCSSSASSDGDDVEVPSPPLSVEVSLVPEDAPDTLEVIFEPSAGADAHLVHLDGVDDPVRVAPWFCSDGACRLRMDRLTAGDATTLTVTAVVGSGESEPSEPVPVPSWPAISPAPAAPPGGPVELVIVRQEPGGSPIVETEIVPAGGDVEARIAALEAEDGVVAVSVNSPGGTLGAAQGSDDDDYPVGLATWQQEAFNFEVLPSTGGDGVTVAILDTGVDVDHEAFAGADIEAIDFVGAGTGPDGHGTGVASLIVGQRSGAVPGVAPAATVRAYNVSHDGTGAFGVGSVADAIIQAVDDGADVINVSWSVQCGRVGPTHYGCPPDALAPAVAYAESQGVVVVAAAGNDGDGADWCDGAGGVIDRTNADHWPAKYDTVIAVGGTSRNGDQWVCSPDKGYVDVLAPSQGLLIADPDESDGYFVSSGTSLAAPLVTGFVATILADHPDLTPEQVRGLLASAADSNGRLLPGAVMMLLGYEDTGPVVDPATLAQIVPFYVDFAFDEDHPASQQARAMDRDETTGDYDPGVDGHLVDYEAPIGAIGAAGLLFRNDDGSITGHGQLVVSAHEPLVMGARNPGVRHRVECPDLVIDDFRTPRLIYGWHVPVEVVGQIADAHAEIVLSLGEGATPDAAGELPGMTILEDTTADCPAAMADGAGIDDHEQQQWDLALERRDTNIPAYETFYRLVVASSPLDATVLWPSAQDGEPLHETQSGDESGGVTMHVFLAPGGYG